MLLNWKPDPEPNGERKAWAGTYRAHVYLARNRGVRSLEG